MTRPTAGLRLWLLVVPAAGFAIAARGSEDEGADASAPSPPAPTVRAFVAEYCTGCHDSESRKGRLDLATVGAAAVGEHPGVWEKVVRKLRARKMPPDKEPRPDERTYDAVVTALEAALDGAAAERPDPGRTETIRRLNRTEYENAIRDLLALEIDAAALLPPDEAGHGFDNVTLGDLSPTLLERYVAAAQKISRLALGGGRDALRADTIRIRPDVTQEEHVDGLPLGTRGGAHWRYNFPLDGEYDIDVRLTRDRNEEVEGLREPHELEVLLDRARVRLFTVAPPASGEGHARVDEHLRVRFPVTAGPHDLGVTFLKYPSALAETRRQPYNARFNMHRHPRRTPAIFQVSITGPHGASGPGDTPSRRLLACAPAGLAEEEECAERILGTLLRRAYRRPVTAEDLAGPLAFFREARAAGDFEAGIEAALSAILVSPRFLLRIEADPPGVAPGTIYPVSDLDLASRLAFFLWSSIPEAELLAAAAAGVLSEPRELERHVRRMLADARSWSLATNFAGQWLHLRNLASAVPDQRLFPDFDDNLRQSLRRETELFFASIVREDRSVLDLLSADYTYLDERLARHYGIPHVHGSRFRRVTLDGEHRRGGLLRHGSVLTVTSYATRTSPVVRGRWVLENLLGSPPPPPPPDVPALADNTVSAALPIRERLAAHRAAPACAGCHRTIDPVGFALENFDAVGRWRTLEAGEPVDATGSLPGGEEFEGVAGLEQDLLNRPEEFAGALAEKLLTFALGRGVEHHDGPAMRKIVREARAEGYRFSSFVLGVAKSAPFRLRKAR